MRRFNYGINCQGFNSSKMTWLTPLQMVEVAPGETLTGRFTTHVWSDTTVKPIMNRCYYDTYAFYVPFRLLWDDWTTFISERHKDGPSTLTVPRATNLSEFLMERVITDRQPEDECIAFQRRAYNLIFNKFFRHAWYPELDLDQNLPGTCSVRPTTWHESAIQDSEFGEDTKVPVVGGEVSIHDLRQGFARDRFDKIRTYYGQDYTDYLAALGVKTGWAIAEEPELLGRCAKDLVYKNTNATVTDTTGPDVNVGDSAGYFENKQACRIKPTFCPEHGIVMMLGVARMDVVNLKGSAFPLLGKSTADHYYTPEMESEEKAQRSNRFWGSDAGGATGADNSLFRFESYRKGSNQIGTASGTEANMDALYFHSQDDGTLEPLNYLSPLHGTFDKMFTGSMGGTDNVHFSLATEVRMRKKSPVKPPRSYRGVA